MCVAKGIVLAEPSVVAVDSTTNEVLAVGHKAKAMLGKTPRKIHAVRPMKDGVIADFEIAEGMIKALIKRVTPARSLFRPKILIAVPSGITGVEKRAVEDSALQCRRSRSDPDRRADGSSHRRRSSRP